MKEDEFAKLLKSVDAATGALLRSIREGRDPAAPRDPFRREAVQVRLFHGRR